MRKAKITMEKKVPERKVNLREEDVFYVYDKRINRCIKENCEGNVKYGLVLRVNVTEEETLNSFECNKCHMKYTPYPNYVRLTKTDMLHIYNKEEVDARDRKRAEDAARQAARDRKKNMQSRGSYSKTHRDNAHHYSEKNGKYDKYETKTFERKRNETKPTYGRKTYEKSYQYRISDTNGGYRKPFRSEQSADTHKSNVVIVSGNYKKDASTRDKSYRGGKKTFYKRSEAHSNDYRNRYE